MSSRCLSIAAAVLLTAASLESAQPALRVCADPNNMPFSNQKGQGFENKLAELIAAKMGAKLEYTWWSQRKSFVKNSLGQGRCDVLMGVPTTLGDVVSTRPYYKSSYVFVSRTDRNLHVASLSDPRLERWRIGIQVVGDDFAPPAIALARRGITKNVVGYSLFGPYGEANPASKIMTAVEHGDVDIAIVWGPLAGYFAKKSSTPLDLVPVSPAMFLAVPFSYEISMGVRPGDDQLRSQLDSILAADAGAVQRILSQYGVPQIQ